MIASRSLLSGSLLAGMLLAAPAGAQVPEPVKRWRSGDPVPLGFHVEKRPILGLLVTGSVLLGGFWLTGAALGSAEIHNGGAYAFIPLAGPFVAAARYQSPSCNSNSWFCWDLGGAMYQTFEIVSGIAQVAGLALLIPGLIVRREKLFPDVVPVPIVGQDRAGIGFFGSF